MRSLFERKNVEYIGKRRLFDFLMKQVLFLVGQLGFFVILNFHLLKIK